MTDTRFSVQLDEVGMTVSRLGVLEQHLAQATAAHTRAAQHDCGDVTSGATAFADHWKTGMDDLHRTVHDLHLALGAARAGYVEHEAALASGLSGHG